MKICDFIEEVDRHATGEVAEECISSLIKCLEMNNIDLSGLPKFNSSVALRRGLPFTFINPEAYNNELFSKVCTGFSKNHKFNENDFAEISAIALLSALNPKLIEGVERSSEKSHDFDVAWSENKVEVEVTRPGEKDEWSNRVSQSQELATYASELKRNFNINIYLPDLLSKSDQVKLRELISKLEIGERVEEYNKWLVISEKPYGDPKVLFENRKDNTRPEWWPTNTLNGFSMLGMLAGPDQTDPLPRIHVKFSCPFNGYINRAKKKATSFQGTRTKPFLLVLDVNALGDPFKVFKKNLNYYFQKWNHITAVLIFIDLYSIDEIGWEFQLFMNPHASRSFDEETQKILSEYFERKRVVKHYA